MSGDSAISCAPMVVERVGELHWDDEADVVVAGFGGAGAVASIQARELGASVIALDRFAGGGATAYSGGVIYSGGTRHQRECGYDDTAEEMYNYLDAEGSAVAATTLRRFCEGSNADIEWLESLGVPYGGNVFEGKTAFPPDGYWIYYSGNEKMPEFSSVAKPAPRGHRVARKGFVGAFYFETLRKAALAKGTRLLVHAPVSRLVISKDNQVLGVEIKPLPQALWKKHLALYKVVHPWLPFNGGRAGRAIAKAKVLELSASQARLIRARKGVILATGGFNNNIEMLSQYRPVLANNFKKLLRLGSMGDDGRGIRMAESAGATTALMENIGVARTLAPPNVFAHGVIVNQGGERFVNEAAYAFVVGSSIIEQAGGGKAWLLLESKDFWQGVRQSFITGGNFLLWGAPALLNIFFGGTRRANSISGLAKKISVNAAALETSIAEFNQRAGTGAADPLGKLAELVKPVKNGPFYAINLSLDNNFSPAQMMTMGGLVVDEDSGAVKRADGSSITGLYAAGRSAVGICSNGYMSGLAIADTVFSGRRAGRSAAGQPS